MRIHVVAAVLLGGIALGGRAHAGKPRCHVSFTQATLENPRCSITSPCVEGQPCASSASFVECGEKASGCGRTFECKCPERARAKPSHRRPGHLRH